MKLDDIKIFPFFSEPNPDKLARREWEYLQSGMAEFNIVVDAQGNLIDGYCWYLLAKRYGLTDVPVRRYSGRREIVKAYGTLKTAIKKPGKKMSDDTQFVLCPVCGCKSRQKVRRDTVARRLPVFCSKCKQTTVVNVSEGFYVEVI